MTVQADLWLTTQIAPPPREWVAIFNTSDGVEVLDVVAVLLQKTDTRDGWSARCALAVAKCDGYLIPACDQDDFVGTMPRTDYDAAARGSNRSNGGGS